MNAGGGRWGRMFKVDARGGSWRCVNAEGGGWRKRLEEDAGGGC